jgi:hypothetical protein
MQAFSSHSGGNITAAFQLPGMLMTLVNEASENELLLKATVNPELVIHGGYGWANVANDSIVAHEVSQIESLQYSPL